MMMMMMMMMMYWRSFCLFSFNDGDAGPLLLGLLFSRDGLEPQMSTTISLMVMARGEEETHHCITDDGWDFHTLP